MDLVCTEFMTMVTMVRRQEHSDCQHSESIMFYFFTKLKETRNQVTTSGGYRWHVLILYLDLKYLALK